MSDEPLPNSEIILYQTEDGRTRIQCRFENESLWLAQAFLAELFEKDVRTINEHLVNIFDEGELRREATIRKFRMVRIEGKREVAREITEDQLEQPATQWFQDTGWNYVHGAVVAPEGVAAEQEDFRAVVLKGRLAEAVRRLNPKLPESAVEEVRRRVAMPGQVLHVVTKQSFRREPGKSFNKERRYLIALTMRGPWGSGLARFMGIPWASAIRYRRSLGKMPCWGGRIGREPKA